MNKSILKCLNIVNFLITIYLSSSLKIHELEFKKKLSNFVIYAVSTTIVLLSLWLSTQLLIFFWLLSFNLSYMQTAFFLVSLNLTLLLIIFLCFKLNQQRHSSANNSNLNLLLNFIIKIIEKYKN